MISLKAVQVGEPKNAIGLTPYLSPLGVWALAFGCSVGWGAFVMPGTLFLPSGGPLGTLLGMLAGTVVMLVIGKNYQYMMNQYPDAGGTFSYTKKIFGYDHGFFNAWFLSLAYIAIIWANATALALIAQKVLGDVFQVGFHYQVVGYDVYFGEALLSIFALVLVGLFCMRWKYLAGMLQTAFAVLLLLGIFLCFATAMGSHEGGLQSLAPAFTTERNPLAQIFLVMTFAPWAFIGFESISHSAEEFRFSVKKSYWIMGTALIAGFFAYVLLAELAIAILPPDHEKWTTYIASLGNLEGLQGIPTFFVTYEVLGKTGIAILGVTVLAGILTGLIGNYIGASRLLYALGKDRILPAWFCVLGKDQSPRNAILFIMLISLVIPFIGRTAIGWIVDVLTLAATIAYGYTSAAAYVTARKNADRSVQVTGIIGLVMSVVFSVHLLVPNLWDGNALATESYLILAFWSILGFVFFRFVFRRDQERRFGQSTVAWLVMLFLIFFSSLMWMRQSNHAAMEEVIQETNAFYTKEMESQGFSQNRHRQENEARFLARQAENIQDSLMWSSSIQMVIIALSLGIMFNIYSSMRSREKQMEVEKVQAEKHSQAKTAFLSNMSHDIRTPMNAIIGYIELSKREQAVCEVCTREKCDKDIPKKQREFMEKIEVSSRHLLSLINDILEMSRIESGKMELEEVPTDLRHVMRDIRDMFATQMHEKGISFTVDASQVENRMVLCDAKRLNRVLLNLISNAYKFTPEGGSVNVMLAQTEDVPAGTEAREELDASKEYLSYELRVKDTGIGMSEEFAKKVFSAFERERTSTVSGIQGTGLGMAITKSIIEMMHGTIRVVTAKGEGTEFVVSMRLEAAPEIEEKQEEELQEAPAETVNFSQKRLLLVDDIDVNREIANMLLTGMGFMVDVAKDGKEAVEKVAASQPGDYDLVLMDIQMPVMNGYEATKAIRALADSKLANIPIIAMTANAFSEDIQTAKEAGMDGHIAKPLDIPKMMATMQEVLNHSDTAG